MKPKCFPGTETLILNRNEDIENIEQKDRQILKIMLGTKHTDKLTADLTVSMKWLWIKFCGHIKRMDPSRLRTN